MTAADLVEALEGRGVRLAERDRGRLSIRPADRVRPEELDALRREKAVVLALLRGRALGVGWSRIQLNQLNRVLELPIPGWDQSLVIAPGCRVTRELRSQDPKPGRVWCVCEILDLIIMNVPPADARKVAEATLMFDSTITGAVRLDREVAAGTSATRDQDLRAASGPGEREGQENHEGCGRTRGRRP
jgi:hypothetical protein